MIKILEANSVPLIKMQIRETPMAVFILKAGYCGVCTRYLDQLKEGLTQSHKWLLFSVDEEEATGWRDVFTVVDEAIPVTMFFRDGELVHYHERPYTVEQFKAEIARLFN